MQKIGKEVKIGLAVIGVLLAAFGYVLVKRLTQPADAAAADQAAASDPAAGGGARAAADKPTVVSATDSDRPSETAGEPKRSSWSIGAEHGANADSKRGEPASDGKNPFATTSREAAASPDPRGGSMFTHNDEAPGSRRHEGDRDDGHRADPAFSAVQASDAAPLAPAAADQTVPTDPHSIFAKPSDKGFGGDKDKGFAGDKPRSDATGADPIQQRPADGAASPDPFQRHTADASSPGDPFQHNQAPPDADSHHTAGQPFGERPSAQSQPNALTPVDNPPLRPTGAGDTAADTHNPLRHLADADSAPATGAADRAGSFPNQNRFAPSDPPVSNQVVPPREGSAFDSSANRLGPDTGVAPVGIRSSGLPDALAPRVADTAAAPPGQYIVQPNDNYWTISEKVYGTGGYFKAIFEHNRRQHPKAERLQVGEVLFVPDVATLQQNYPDLCPKPGHASAPQRTMPASARMRPGTRVYVVEEGDTLSMIAKHELGVESRWPQIYILNREVLGDKNYDYLKPGTELLIPTTDARPDPIASRPTGTSPQ